LASSESLLAVRSPNSPQLVSLVLQQQGVGKGDGSTRSVQGRQAAFRIEALRPRILDSSLSSIGLAEDWQWR
jgi:hypothetical protein